jgi:hypothetical protein
MATIHVDRVCSLRKVSVVFATVREFLGVSRLFNIRNVDSGGLDVVVVGDVNKEEEAAIRAAVEAVLPQKGRRSG